MARETFRNKCIRLNKTIADNSFTYDLKSHERTKAIERICPAHVIASKRKAYCSHCGSEVHVLTQKECPVCHKKWGGIESVERASRHSDYEYLCVMSVMEGLQVLRFWYVGYQFKPGERTYYHVEEVERQFIREDGCRTGFALSKPMFTGGRYDAWNWSSEIKIRDLSQRYYGYYGDTTTPRFDLPCKMTIIKQTIPLLRRNGLRKSMHGTWFPVALTLGLLKTQQVEELWKTGQWDMAEWVVEHGRISTEKMQSVRVATRKHYRIKDAKMWLDHLTTLENLNLDTHNAHYVCPKNLEKEHQQMVERYNRERNRIEERRRAKEYAERLKKMEKEKTAYIERMGVLLTLSLKGRNLSIRPLQTVDEFAEEGTAMHHCVFANRYYAMPDCLILSAKDSKGKRLATIEYNTSRFAIEQCRAACNKVPERDAEIRALITSHTKDFKRLLKAA